MNNPFKKLTIFVICFVGLFTLFSKKQNYVPKNKSLTLIEYSKPKAQTLQKPDKIIALSPQETMPLRPEDSSPSEGLALFPEEVSLTLVDAYSSSNKLSIQSFEGELKISETSIDYLSLSINQQLYEFSFANLNNNTFEYDIDGEIISGIIYQADQHQYIVSFVNGPLDGVKLEFRTQIQLSEIDLFAIEDRLNNPPQ